MNAQRPAQHAEQALINAILDGRLPIGAKLPGERELATQFGITRPTLRETLARLGADGWITVAHGKSTVVNDYWRDGGLNVLCAILRSVQPVDPQFVTWLLQIRVDLAPSYTRQAFGGDLSALRDHLRGADALAADGEAFSHFDWEVHSLLTQSAGNPVYGMILNGFRELYRLLGKVYFTLPEARTYSLTYYRELRDCAERDDVAAAVQLTQATMEQSLAYWHVLQGVS